MHLKKSLFNDIYLSREWNFKIYLFAVGIF